jgi:hypothetical protein
MASAMEKDCGIWENFYSRDFFSFVLADALSRDGGAGCRRVADELHDPAAARWLIVSYLKSLVPAGKPHFMCGS